MRRYCFEKRARILVPLFIVAMVVLLPGCSAWTEGGTAAGDIVPRSAPSPNEGAADPEIRITVRDTVVVLIRPEVVGDSVRGFTRNSWVSANRRAYPISALQRVEWRTFDPARTALLIVATLSAGFFLLRSQCGDC
jgi:hypothetical protein